jgi:hypothetical protein
VDTLSVAARKLRTLEQIGAFAYTYIVGTREGERERGGGREREDGTQEQV